MNDLIISNLSEIQVKFKILYLYKSFPEKSHSLTQKVKPIITKISLKILSLSRLKEVFCGKFRNRLVYNYFRKMKVDLSTFSALESNILFLDSTYSSTVAVTDIYHSFINK